MWHLMKRFSTREAAKKLGISPIALSRYIANGKVPAPQIVTLGRFTVHVWTEAEIERVRKLLPKIANGRKTRWQRQKAQGKSAVPRKPKKK
jgi:predicted DNA-binding transcriptional regulator AlpA